MIFAQYKRLFWFTLALHINFNLNIWYIQRASRFRAWKNPRENLRDSVNDWRIHYQSCYNGGRVVFMLISLNDYFSPLKIIIRRPGEEILNPGLTIKQFRPTSCWRRIFYILIQHFPLQTIFWIQYIYTVYIFKYSIA